MKIEVFLHIYLHRTESFSVVTEGLRIKLSWEEEKQTNS